MDLKIKEIMFNDISFEFGVVKVFVLLYVPLEDGIWIAIEFIM